MQRGRHTGKRMLAAAVRSGAGKASFPSGSDDQGVARRILNFNRFVLPLEGNARLGQTRPDRRKLRKLRYEHLVIIFEAGGLGCRRSALILPVK